VITVLYHAKLSLACRCCIGRMHEAASVLNADASVVKVNIRFGVIGGAAYCAHKIAHCRASEHQNTDRHTVVAAQPKMVIEHLTCTCSRAICATQKQRGSCYCSLRTWHDSLSTCEPSGAIRLSTKMYKLGSSADHRAGPELPCSIMFQLPWNTKQA